MMEQLQTCVGRLIIEYVNETCASGIAQLSASGGWSLCFSEHGAGTFFAQLNSVCLENVSPGVVTRSHGLLGGICASWLGILPVLLLENCMLTLASLQGALYSTDNTRAHSHSLRRALRSSVTHYPIKQASRSWTFRRALFHSHRRTQFDAERGLFSSAFASDIILCACDPPRW